jgi:hypothetical protein
LTALGFTRSQQALKHSPPRGHARRRPARSNTRSTCCWSSPLVGLGEPQAEVDEVGVDDFLGVYRARLTDLGGRYGQFWQFSGLRQVLGSEPWFCARTSSTRLAKSDLSRLIFARASDSLDAQ